jgi:hypothetical protein
MRLLAGHGHLVPALPLGAGHHTDRLARGFEDRPLLDMGLEIGGDRAAADRPDSACDDIATDLEEAAKDAWNKRQNTWEIEPWLELLPFTTRPEAVIEGLSKVKAFCSTNWAKHWDRVLRAVAALPGADGERLLAAVARTCALFVFGWCEVSDNHATVNGANPRFLGAASWTIPAD